MDSKMLKDAALFGGIGVVAGLIFKKDPVIFGMIGAAAGLGKNLIESAAAKSALDKAVLAERARRFAAESAGQMPPQLAAPKPGMGPVPEPMF